MPFDAPVTMATLPSRIRFVGEQILCDGLSSDATLGDMGVAFRLNERCELWSMTSAEIEQPPIPRDYSPPEDSEIDTENDSVVGLARFQARRDTNRSATLTVL